MEGTQADEQTLLGFYPSDDEDGGNMSIAPSDEERALLAGFMALSVTQGTLKRYCPWWAEWVEFVSGRTQNGRTPDPFLSGVSASDKGSLLILLFKSKYEAGKREKAATGIGAAVRKHFEINLRDTKWLDSPLITQGRRACRRSVAENREYAKSGKSRARLPVWVGLLYKIREELWEGRPWDTSENLTMKMTYIATMFAFDTAARAGEATTTGGVTEVHTILAEDVIVHLEVPVVWRGQMIHSHRGGSEILTECFNVHNVRAIEVCAQTHKPGKINHTKTIGRRSDEEEEFLLDLYQWLAFSGTKGGDELFSRWARRKNGKVSKLLCRSKMVTGAIKDAVAREGMDPGFFSFHSLRKAAVTQMKALGVSRDETLSRGNYSKDSVMIDTAYDYDSSGRGPLAAMSGKRDRLPGKEEAIKRMPLPFK